MVKKIKKAVRIRNPQEIIDIVDDLYEEAISGRPTVWIDVPIVYAGSSWKMSTVSK